MLRTAQSSLLIERGLTEKVGDMVYLKFRKAHMQTLAPGQHSKLSLKYFGSYPIVARIGKVAYKL